MSDPDDFARAADRTVGAALRARREDLHLSQEDLAAELGVTHQQLSKYESGRDRITAGRLAAAARFLGCDVAWFFDPENTVAQRRKHCELLPLEALLPSFAGEGLTVRVLFTVDAEAGEAGEPILSIDVVALVDTASLRAPLPLPRALYPAMLRHGAPALLTVAAAEPGSVPLADAAPRAGAALN
ncbi:helix-turn-helix domain-containing protein [Lichenibacterium dinghuense]|uniref:helix-turn-helix domain-containing protein n=1 Tax=Lichenibacterium dinghuense TaxID=2895977 RepID=UPI001F2C358F|nr:helix-turn-helix transcriptional regulator [Lichenibacterium sp. 6Y81]